MNGNHSSSSVNSTRFSSAKKSETSTLNRRSRLAPNATPPQKNVRGKIPSPRTKSSTPTGISSSTPNRSCNFSPIHNPTEKSEPKILKTLGPQVFDRKNSFRSNDGTSKSKTGPADPVALYMLYQQQHYINSLMKQTKEKVLSEGKKQLQDLWALVQQKEKEILTIESRTKLVDDYIEHSQLADQLEPALKDITDVVGNVSTCCEELAQSLDGNRHKIHLVNINPIEEKDIDTTCTLMKQATSLCSDIQAEKMKEIVEAASILSQLDATTNDQLKIMDECQRMSMLTLTRLGQELSLDAEDVAFKKLSDLDF